MAQESKLGPSYKDFHWGMCIILFVVGISTKQHKLFYFYKLIKEFQTGRKRLTGRLSDFSMAFLLSKNSKSSDRIKNAQLQIDFFLFSFTKLGWQCDISFRYWSSIRNKAKDLKRINVPILLKRGQDDRFW